MEGRKELRDGKGREEQKGRQGREGNEVKEVREGGKGRENRSASNTIQLNINYCQNVTFSDQYILLGHER